MVIIQRSEAIKQDSKDFSLVSPVNMDIWTY